MKTILKALFFSITLLVFGCSVDDSNLMLVCEGNKEDTMITPLSNETKNTPTTLTIKIENKTWGNYPCEKWTKEHIFCGSDDKNNNMPYISIDRVSGTLSSAGMHTSSGIHTSFRFEGKCKKTRETKF